MLVASNGISAGNGGWGYEFPQHRDLLTVMGPDRRHPVAARAVRASINPAVSMGCAEVEPSCAASAWSSRPARSPKQLFCAPVSAPSIATTARSWGWNRSTGARRVKVWVASARLVRTPALDGRSSFTVRNTRCAQACDAAAALAFPSAKYLVIAAVSLPVQSTAQGNTRDWNRAAQPDRIGEAKGACEAALVQALAALRHPRLQQPSRVHRQVGRDQPAPA
jgi:hypothetical protein